MIAPQPVRVLLDGSPLQDGRRTAGIGRYVIGISDALTEMGGLQFKLATTRQPRRDSWVVRYLSAQPELCATALWYRPTLVHGMASDPLLGWPLSRQVVTVHDVIPWTQAQTGPWTARYLAIQRRRLRGVAAVIAVSPGVAADISNVLAVRTQRIHVVSNGVSSAFSAARSDGDVPERNRLGVADGRYLLWVGSMRHHDPRKAIDTLLDAAALISPAVPLVLAGATGQESDRIASIAAARGTAVITTGYVNDACLAALYRGAAAVVVPSREEGFGLPALEAMACGAPLVAVRGTNTADMAGEACLLAEPGDPRSLAAAITILLTDRGRVARLRQVGLERAAHRTWRHAAQLTIGVYQSVASRLGRSSATED